jgi:ribonuclease-3
VIAALYLDGGLEAAKHFVLRYWEDSSRVSSRSLRDAKTALQEWAQSARCRKGTAFLSVKQRLGPIMRPCLRWRFAFRIGTSEQGEGSNKRDAEQDAARRMLVRLGLWKE